MDKIKNLFVANSIKTAFVTYMFVCILSALVLSFSLSKFCQFGQSWFYQKYQPEYEALVQYIEMENQDRSNGQGVLRYYTDDIRTFLTSFELAVYNILGVLSIACYPVCFMICIAVTSAMFYKRQMQKPLEILGNVADHISDNNLDFTIEYDKQDELGKLCLSFEKMRFALQNSNMEMWRQMEERRRLNAAFAHDLRTPLTVLKGQSEMLAKYAPKMPEQKIIETAQVMQRHIIRLEQYVNTMNNLQRLEDIEIQKSETKIANVIKQMEDTADTICKTKKLIMKKGRCDHAILCLDGSVILQVYENLLANAVRYADNVISVSVSVKDDCFFLNVSDDGKGFQAEELSEAIKPFYKSSDENSPEHFGIGLNVCKILCEKHGGYLKLENRNGASVTAVFKEALKIELG